jgi:hypothetical protein
MLYFIRSIIFHHVIKNHPKKHQNLTFGLDKIKSNRNERRKNLIHPHWKTIQVISHDIFSTHSLDSNDGIPVLPCCPQLLPPSRIYPHECKSLICINPIDPPLP